MSRAWDHEPFKEFVLRQAVNRFGIEPGPRATSRLAEQLGFSPSMVSKWLRGVERPSPGSVRQMAPRLGVAVPALLSLTGHLDDDGDTEPIAVSERADLSRVRDEFKPTLFRLINALSEDSRIPLDDQRFIDQTNQRWIADAELRARRRAS